MFKPEKLPKPGRAFRSADERERDREAKRMAVLRTAAAMFCRKGYAATQMGDVARALGVTKPTIYHYFKSKDEILSACFATGTQLFEDSWLQTEEPMPDGRARLRAAMLLYARCMMQDFGKCCALVPVSTLEEPARSRITGQMRYFDTEFRRLILAAVEDGSIPACDAKVATFAMLGALNWIAKWHVEGDPAADESMARALVDQILRGHSTPNAG